MLHGASPVIRTFRTFTDFETGKFQQISLLSDGQLGLAPQRNLICDTGEPYVWALARDSHGTLYLGTGNDGRVYKVTAKGDTSLFFDAPELEVYALAVDQRDRLYAATSPNGKVYRINNDGSNAIFFDPDETYIWDILIDATGDLLVATGSKAKLFRVKPDGSKVLIFTSEAEHLRCLSKDQGNRIYFASSGPGLIYRLLPGDRPFVLYDPSVEEVHDITIASDGMLFAAVFTEIESVAPSGPSGRSDKSDEPMESEDELNLSQAAMLVSEALAAKSKTQLLMIDPDGYAKEIWATKENVQTVLAADKDVLVGTNKNGRLFRVNRSGEASLIVELQAVHISSILQSADNELFLATSDMGQLYQLTAHVSVQGTYESETIDSGNLASWGVLQWQGKGKTIFSIRTGNAQKPESTWSPWEAIAPDQDVYRIKNPAARFLQWRCELYSQKDNLPAVENVSISYIQKNLAPEITSITIHPANEYLNWEGSEQNKNGITTPQQAPKGETRKGTRSIDWQFSDPNQDPVLFDLALRHLPEEHWRALTQNLANSFFSWDTQQMSDGKYQIKITATDSCNLPHGMGLPTVKISEIFIIDNTGPVIKEIHGKKNDIQWTFTFTVCDQMNLISQVEYSVNAQGWQTIYPSDGICDSKCESFIISLPTNTTQGEISIRAMDALENYSTSHTTIKEN